MKWVNSSGERVLKACCHIASIGLSFSIVEAGSVCCVGIRMMFCVEIS